MVFTSQFFLFYFLPLVVGIYYALPVRARNLFLALASYVFYGWWSPWFVTLMAASTAIDWFRGIAVSTPGASQAKRKRAVLISVVCNLSLLGFFKYFMFAAESIDRLTRAFGADGFEVMQVVLPVGISFYTFQSMSYCIDIYRGQAERARNITDFACYISMFPQLVAGPIVRYHDIAEQLHSRPQKGERIHGAVLYFMIGFAKKVLLANTLGEVADATFDAGSLSAGAAWFGITAYAFQIYFDFSGYSDMAIGLGGLFGFRMPVNFKSPYRSKSITEFWTRWHVSLSSWLRDYLYIPLGGNRRGALLTYRNLMIVMLLGGLWHGANWTFLAWGLFHGTILCLERLAGRSPVYAALPGTLRCALTFVLVLFSWVLFRAPDIATAGEFMGAMFTGAGDPAAAALLSGRLFQPFYLVALASAAACIWFGRETREVVEWSRTHGVGRLATTGAFALAVLAMFSQAENPFLYFQF